MSIPDLPTPPETTGQSKAGLKFHILGTVQQVLAVELQPGRLIFSDAGAMSWMTSSVSMTAFDIQMVQGIANILFGGEG